jgi:hypothetical protein
VSIEADLRDWSSKVLEIPNVALKGLPACPYAKEAWKQNKVNVIETEYLGIETIKQASNFDGTYDLVVVASYKFPSQYQFQEFIDYLNTTYTKNDLHIMGFHPEYGAEDAELDFLYEHDWESAVEDEYAMLFIQSLSQVDDASLKLEKLGYYDVYPEEEYQALVLDRRKRRLQNGDETSCNEEEDTYAWRRYGS